MRSVCVACAVRVAKGGGWRVHAFMRYLPRSREINTHASRFYFPASLLYSLQITCIHHLLTPFYPITNCSNHLRSPSPPHSYVFNHCIQSFNLSAAEVWDGLEVAAKTFGAYAKVGVHEVVEHRYGTESGEQVGVSRLWAFAACKRGVAGSRVMCDHVCLFRVYLRLPYAHRFGSSCQLLCVPLGPLSPCRPSGLAVAGYRAGRGPDRAAHAQFRRGRYGSHDRLRVCEADAHAPRTIRCVRAHDDRGEGAGQNDEKDAEGGIHEPTEFRLRSRGRPGRPIRRPRRTSVACRPWARRH